MKTKIISAAAAAFMLTAGGISIAQGTGDAGKASNIPATAGQQAPATTGSGSRDAKAGTGGAPMTQGGTTMGGTTDGGKATNLPAAAGQQGPATAGSGSRDAKASGPAKAQGGTTMGGASDGGKSSTVGVTAGQKSPATPNQAANAPATGAMNDTSTNAGTTMPQGAAGNMDSSTTVARANRPARAPRPDRN